MKRRESGAGTAVGSAELLHRLEQLALQAQAALAQAADLETIAAESARFLGRNGAMNQVLELLTAVPKADRAEVGRKANEVKATLEAAFAGRRQAIEAIALQTDLERERLDVTLPGRPVGRGRVHPANLSLRSILRIWAEMGFQVYRSRQVETDDYNFGLLNIPPYHPARDQWDTFYTTDPQVLLRTHTSPGQIHVMRERAPQPIRVVLPGMCYRYEQVSARAEVQFNQIEGVAVGRHITMADLKGTLAAFARRTYGASVETRFRAGHFPFTEPSAEMDVECFVCGGSGCPVCKGSGWLEVLGCGMVHPTVLANGGYDPAEFSGYAFGMGPERVAILKHRIDHIRHFWANDLRFLEQF